MGAIYFLAKFILFIAVLYQLASIFFISSETKPSKDYDSSVQNMHELQTAQQLNDNGELIESGYSTKFYKIPDHSQFSNNLWLNTLKYSATCGIRLQDGNDTTIFLQITLSYSPQIDLYLIAPKKDLDGIKEKGVKWSQKISSSDLGQTYQEFLTSLYKGTAAIHIKNKSYQLLIEDTYLPETKTRKRFFRFQAFKKRIYIDGTLYKKDSTEFLYNVNTHNNDKRYWYSMYDEANLEAEASWNLDQYTADYPIKMEKKEKGQMEDGKGPRSRKWGEFYLYEGIFGYDKSFTISSVRFVNLKDQRVTLMSFDGLLPDKPLNGCWDKIWIGDKVTLMEPMEMAWSQSKEKDYFVAQITHDDKNLIKTRKFMSKFEVAGRHEFMDMDQFGYCGKKEYLDWGMYEGFLIDENRFRMHLWFYGWAYTMKFKGYG